LKQNSNVSSSNQPQTPTNGYFFEMVSPQYPRLLWDRPGSLGRFHELPYQFTSMRLLCRLVFHKCFTSSHDAHIAFQSFWFLSLSQRWRGAFKFGAQDPLGTAYGIQVTLTVAPNRAAPKAEVLTALTSRNRKRTNK
jgi:hypothetical protein